jgi:hypothetical protein
MRQSLEVSVFKASVRRGVRPRSDRTHAALDFASVSEEMARLAAVREEVVMNALAALEERYALLAEMLVAHFGSRSKEARWMCSRQHCLEGRTGYDVIVAGEVDMVWDKVTTKAVLAV